jgi:hypothetical protein
MRFPLCLLAVLGLLGAVDRPLQAQHYSGVSSIAALPFPDRDLPGVALSRALVDLRQLDTVAEYRLALEFENRSGAYQVTEMVTPLRFHFHEFRPELRAALLDRIVRGFPEDFGVPNTYDDIRDALRDNFGKRLFIRKFVSTMDLAKLGIAAQAQVGDLPLGAKKIFLEFRWQDPEDPELAGTGQVLVLDLRVTHELRLKPGERKTVDMRLVLPSLISGRDDAQYYAPFELAGPNRWDGGIDRLYLLHDVREGTAVLPRGLAFRTLQEGEHGHVTLFEALNPRAGDRVAFADRRGAQGDCSTDRSPLYFPQAVTGVSASSWIDKEKTLEGFRVRAGEAVVVADAVPEYEHLSGRDLSLWKAGLLPQARPNPAFERVRDGGCASGEGSVLLDGYCHPVFAFDQGPANGFATRTAWCENASGSGAGETLRFELLQPASAMRIQNGYQLSQEKYDANSRVRSVKLSREADGWEKILPVSDLRILNLYELSLPAGRYTLEIRSTYPGDYPTACLSGVSFDFEVPDPWFREHVR